MPGRLAHLGIQLSNFVRWVQAARISFLGIRNCGKLELKPPAASRTKFAYVRDVCVLNKVIRVDACVLDVCEAVVFSVSFWLKGVAFLEYW